MDMVSRDRSPRGERNGQSKLTDEAVSIARSSSDTHLALAERFGVARQTMSKALAGLTWKHVVLTLFVFIPAMLIAAPKSRPVPTPEATPGRAELLATLDHISSLAKDAIGSLNAEKAAHAATEAGLQKANAENADLQKKIDKETVDFNDLKDKYAAVTKKLSWYRWHWWGSWIVFGLGILAVGFLAFLKFTGKLAIFGASVAAKIP